MFDAGASGAGMHHAGEAALDVGGDLHDAPAAPRDHRARRDRVCHVPGAVQVVADDRVPALGLEQRGGGRELPAGVVDQHVDFPEALDHGVDQRGHRVGLADVAGARKHLEPAGAQRLGGGQEVLLAPAGDRHARAERRELLGDRAPDPGTAAGDERDLSVKERGREGRHEAAQYSAGGAALRARAVARDGLGDRPGPRACAGSASGAVGRRSRWAIGPTSSLRRSLSARAGVRAAGIGIPSVRRRRGRVAAADATASTQPSESQRRPIVRSRLPAFLPKLAAAGGCEIGAVVVMRIAQVLFAAHSIRGARLCSTAIRMSAAA